MKSFELPPDELDAFAKIKHLINFNIPSDAFIRVETAVDFFDAVLLLLSGCNVSVEPVPGVLAGFLHPIEVKYFKAAPSKGLYIGLQLPSIEIIDTPLSIAKAFAELLSIGTWHDEINVSVTGIADTRRRDAVRTALNGFVETMNYRACRHLSLCDITALLSWVAPLAPDRRLDIQVPYGRPGWGAFAKCEKDTYGDGPTPPLTATRSIIFYTKPERYDLEKLLLCCGPIGIVNGVTAQAKLSYDGRLQADFRGTSPDKAVLFSNFGMSTNGSCDLNWIGRPEDVWETFKLTARQLYLARKRPFPALQDAWQIVYDKRPTVILEPLNLFDPAEIPNLRNHALQPLIKLSNDVKQWQPNHATAKRGLIGHAIEALEDQRKWLALDHNAALTVLYSLNDVPNLVDWLRTNWNLFIGADFKPHGN